MALYSVQSTWPPAAADLNQIINLLSGVTGPGLSSVTVSNRIRAQLTGATATSGLVGMSVTNTATSGGPPGTGTYALGDLAVDPFLLCLWVCTTAGTPGTWSRIGGQNTAGGLTTSFLNNQNFSARTGRTAFDVVIFDTQADLFLPFQTESTATSSLTVQYAGTYLFFGSVSMSGSTTGTDSGVMILRNGLVYQFGSQFLGYGSPGLSVMAVMRCAQGDVVQLGLYTEGSYAQTGQVGAITLLQGIHLGN